MPTRSYKARPNQIMEELLFTILRGVDQYGQEMLLSLRRLEAKH